jgi:hypothetical protein
MQPGRCYVVAEAVVDLREERLGRPSPPVERCEPKRLVVVEDDAGGEEAAALLCHEPPELGHSFLAAALCRRHSSRVDREKGCDTERLVACHGDAAEAEQFLDFFNLI